MFLIIVFVVLEEVTHAYFSLSFKNIFPKALSYLFFIHYPTFAV